MGAQTQKKGGKQKGGGARRVAGPKGGGPKIRAFFFSLSCSVLALLFCRWRVFSCLLFSILGVFLCLFFSLWWSSRVFFALSLWGSSSGILVVCLKVETLKCARLGPRAVV